MASENQGSAAANPEAGPGRTAIFPAPVALLDAQGRVEAANECWRAAKTDLLVDFGENFLDVVGNLTASRRVVEGVRDAVGGGKATAFSYDIASGGAEGGRWFRLLAMGREGGGGAVALMDISDHRERPDVHSGDERLRRALESIEDYAIFTLDPGGNVATWNRWAERIEGFRAEEIIGRHFSELYPESDRETDKPARVLASAAAAGRFEDEGWRVRRDGSRFWCNAVLTSLRDARGSLKGYAKLSRDLTERRRAEMAVSDGQARLMSIVDSAMDGIITVDESQRIVMFNKAAERIFGVAAEEAMGGPLTRFIPERFRRSHDEHVRAFGRTGVTTRAMGRLGTLSGLRPDGTEFPIEASISQATWGGQRFYTVILRDVSERQRLEAQLLQSQKMEGIGRLAGGVAHDFNNLLMAMFNYLELANRKLEPGHPAQSSLAHVKQAADRAAALTRQLLAFARKQVINPKSVCPRDIVAGLEPMLRRLIGEDIVLRTTASHDTGNVKADVSQLEQVVVNLAVNARDAMPGGGTLTIETGNISLDSAYCRSRVGATPGEHVMIAVTDTGEGMEQEVLSRLFEPFFTTKPPGKGTGLGLATCHGIVRQSGGHIAVYSEPGRGTSVKVFLPRIKEEAAAGGGGAAAVRPIGGTETILLAEDSEMVRSLATDALRAAGYTVLSAADGQQALAEAASHPGPIQLLVTDVVMPEMNGVRLAEALRAKRPGLRVIFISGYTEETIGHHGVEAESQTFLAKPFMMDVLLRRVREILDAPIKA